MSDDDVMSESVLTKNWLMYGTRAVSRVICRATFRSEHRELTKYDYLSVVRINRAKFCFI